MKKLRLLFWSTASIVILFCVVKFIFIADMSNNSSMFEEGEEDDSNNVLTTKMGPIPEPKLILDANEIANLTIDYNIKVSIEAIINHEPGYEKYYEEIMQWIKNANEEIGNFPFYHEKGF